MGILFPGSFAKINYPSKALFKHAKKDIEEVVHLNRSEWIVHEFVCSGSQDPSLDAQTADDLVEAKCGGDYADATDHRAEDEAEVEFKLIAKKHT